MNCGFPKILKTGSFTHPTWNVFFYDEQFLVFGLFSSIRHIQHSVKDGQLVSECVFNIVEFLGELGKIHKGNLKLVLFNRKGGVVKQVEFVEPRFGFVENFFTYNTCASNNIFVKVEFKEKLEFV